MRKDELRRSHILKWVGFKPLQYVRTTNGCAGCGSRKNHVGVLVSSTCEAKGHERGTVYMKCLKGHTCIGLRFLRPFHGAPSLKLEAMRERTKRLRKQIRHG